MADVKTTVIGSYPVDVDNLELMNFYYDQKEISWNKYIDSAVNDMLNAGIRIVSDGQTRDPFINIYTRKIKGCRIRNRVEIVDKVEFDGPITVNDISYVKRNLPEDREIIGLIAGPYTISKSCVDFFYNDEKELAFDFANVLRQEANLLQEHVDIISVDEPFFSMGVPDFGKELIDIVTKDLKCLKRLHVCGDVSKIIPDIIDMPVHILSHEFKATPKLFDEFKDYSFEKKICLGSVRSDDARVESVDEIVSHINKGISVFGDKINQLAPDCGLKLQKRDVAFQKLKNLVLAGEKVYG